MHLEESLYIIYIQIYIYNIIYIQKSMRTCSKHKQEEDYRDITGYVLNT